MSRTGPVLTCLLTSLSGMFFLAIAAYLYKRRRMRLGWTSMTECLTLKIQLVNYFCWKDPVDPKKELNLFARQGVKGNGVRMRIVCFKSKTMKLEQTLCLLL